MEGLRWNGREEKEEKEGVTSKCKSGHYRDVQQ